MVESDPSLAQPASLPAELLAVLPSDGAAQLALAQRIAVHAYSQQARRHRWK
jgi:hypothetical protein